MSSAHLSRILFHLFFDSQIPNTHERRITANRVARPLCGNHLPTIIFLSIVRAGEVCGPRYAGWKMIFFFFFFDFWNVYRLSRAHWKFVTASSTLPLHRPASVALNQHDIYCLWFIVTIMGRIILHFFMQPTRRFMDKCFCICPGYVMATGGAVEKKVFICKTPIDRSPYGLKLMMYVCRYILFFLASKNQRVCISHQMIHQS